MRYIPTAVLLVLAAVMGLYAAGHKKKPAKETSSSEKNRVFGSIPDRVADGATCSVLMVRKHEPSAVSWLRRTLKRVGERF